MILTLWEDEAFDLYSALRKYTYNLWVTEKDLLWVPCSSRWMAARALMTAPYACKNPRLISHPVALSVSPNKQNEIHLIDTHNCTPSVYGDDDLRFCRARICYVLQRLEQMR